MRPIEPLSLCAFFVPNFYWNVVESAATGEHFEYFISIKTTAHNTQLYKNYMQTS